MIKDLDTKIAVTYGEQKISYSELRRTVAEWALNYSLEAGDHVVIFAENSPAWIFALYSIWQKGGIAIPVDNLATAEETSYILKDCEPKVIFTSGTRQEVIKKATALAGISAEMFLLDNFQLKNKVVQEVAVPHPDPDKTALIVYTSGTTGDPKGVMLSYQNLLTNIKAVSEHIPIYKPESTVMMLLPIHHVLPLVGSVIIPLYIGAKVAISPSMQSTDLMNTLKNNAVTIIIGVPRLYAAIRKGIMDKIRQSTIARMLFSIARKVNNPKFSRKVFNTVHQKMGGSIESLVSGGASLDKEIGADFQTLGFEVLEGYGMTEAAPMITFTKPGRVRIGSPGEVMSETKVVIRDGEITASGPNIMQGYYKKPEETAEILKDGWLYTGDLGYIDKDGYLFITGRKKEIIILSNGKNVNPIELEEKLLQSKYIRDCGVFYHDDQLQVIVVPDYSAISHDTHNSIEEFIKWEVIEPFNKTVSSYKKIMGIHLTDDELPRTRLGKLQRYKLASLAVLADLKDITYDEIPGTPEYKLIAEFLEKEKTKHVLPGHHIEMDLGMDSLDMVNFQAWLSQTFGVDMEPSEMTSFSNIAKLAEDVAQKKTRIEEGKLDWTDIIKEKVNLKIPANWITGRWMVYATKVFFFLYFRIKAKGTANIPEAPVIFVPNHQSSFDGLFIASFLRRRLLKNTYFYAKEKHFKQAWLKYLANRNNIIVVDINKDLKESIQRMAEVLRQKRNLIIFPEGTRSKTGNLGDFKKTFAILSRELNIPIVPVTIKGAYEALPSGSKFPIPWKKISVEFLQPVYPGTHSYDSLTDHVRSKIEGNIQPSSVR
jgi:long-chain acyl-CoA synthetase